MWDERGSGAVSRWAATKSATLATGDTTLTTDEFAQATRASQVTPGQPGSEGLLVLENLKPNQHYVVGIRSLGSCNGQSDIAMVDFMTPNQKFTRLSGCFVGHRCLRFRDGAPGGGAALAARHAAAAERAGGGSSRPLLRIGTGGGGGHRRATIPPGRWRVGSSAPRPSWPRRPSRRDRS